ncbi:hypothetical protein [Methylobacterium oryzisoli]|uniref:hypothetical protein n=1 Tax=Methylobacterium oryzisoli TaxID=3385502 RepID=UPI0038927812
MAHDPHRDDTGRPAANPDPPGPERPRSAFRSRRALALGLLAAALLATAGLAVLLKRPERIFLPPLARDLPANFREADAAFKARIAAVFPIGSSEAALVERLRAQGFALPAGQATPDGPRESRAVFRQTSFPCNLAWHVRWRAEHDRLVEVSADYGGTCL